MNKFVELKSSYAEELMQRFENKSLSYFPISDEEGKCIMTSCMTEYEIELGKILGLDSTAELPVPPTEPGEIQNTL